MSIFSSFSNEPSFQERSSNNNNNNNNTNNNNNNNNYNNNNAKDNDNDNNTANSLVGDHVWLRGVGCLRKK